MSSDTQSPVVHFDGSGVRLRRIDYASGWAQSPHSHEFTSITLVMRGDCEESSEHDNHVSQSCTVLIKPAHVEHANVFGNSGSKSLQISFLPRVFPEFPIRSECRHIEGGPAAARMLALLRSASACGPDSLAAHVREVVSAVADECQPSATRRAPDWVKSLSSTVMKNPAARISVASLADEVGMHPVALARAFRRHCACSITEYLRRARILHASRRIANGDHALVDLAIDSGFADQPHFTRAFRAELGCTPGEFRRLISVG